MNLLRAPVPRARRAPLASACLILACLAASGGVQAQAQTQTPSPVPVVPVAPSAVSALPADDMPSLTLAQLIDHARRNHPALASSRLRITGAEAGLLTARARPNPELELQLGRQSPQADGALRGASGVLSVLQPLERTSLRRSREAVALTGIDQARAGSNAFEREFIAELKLRWYDVLRLQASATLAAEDLAIAEQIRSRVSVRVDSGESPRFELIRADAELLNARRAAQAARLRVNQAQAELRRFTGPGLPQPFRLAASLVDSHEAPAAFGTIRDEMLSRHPELQSIRAELRHAEARAALERERARPAFALRASADRVPEALDARLGVLMSIPIFDRREGPIAEAQADAERMRQALADRELQLVQALDVAWQRYRIALEQVRAYESGILREAQSALRVAEAAYRYGERGILDTLDAQRTLRQVRTELNTTRYELSAALVELERLRPEME
jgi:cobalt-zinc-cadmium efflux system outer membrane protein